MFVSLFLISTVLATEYVPDYYDYDLVGTINDVANANDNVNTTYARTGAVANTNFTMYFETINVSSAALQFKVRVWNNGFENFSSIQCKNSVTGFHGMLLDHRSRQNEYTNDTVLQLPGGCIKNPIEILVIDNSTGVSDGYVDIYETAILYNITPPDTGYIFNFYDEQDGNVFDLNGSNTTVSYRCGANTSEERVTSGTTNISIPCEFSLLKTDVLFSGQSSYYRTLVEQTGPLSVDYYLVNLNNKSVVQVVLEMDDLTGYKWAGSLATITRPVSGHGNVNIIEQYFDVDNRVYLYLMQDEEYTLQIINGDGESWSGSFIADSAETKTITLPGVGFNIGGYYEDDIRINYTFTTGRNEFNVSYRDFGLHTNYVNITLINMSSDEVIDTLSYNLDYNTGVDFNIVNPSIVGNTSYQSILIYNHTILGMVTELQVWGDYTGSVNPGSWDPLDWANLQKWFTFILLTIIILSFGPKNAHIGLVIDLIFMGIFKYLGWMSWLDVIVFGLIAVLIVANYWRKEEVSSA